MVHGSVTAVRGESQTSAVLKFRDSVFSGDRITTRERSAVKILLGRETLLTMRESSELVLGAVDKLGVRLEAGKISSNVRLPQPGSVHSIRTSNAVALVQGVGTVVVEVEQRRATEPESTSLVPVTHVDVLVGTVSAGLMGGPLIQCTAGQGVTITASVLGAVRPIRSKVMSGLRIGAIPGPPIPIHPMQSLGVLADPGSRAVLLPSDWMLLVDRLQGFESRIGTAPEGHVAGDGGLENVTLAVCESEARMQVEQGARVACARVPWKRLRHGDRLRYRDVRGRLMARGPLAGLMVVYEPGAPAANWTLVGPAGEEMPFSVNLEPASCYELSVGWLLERGLRTACVRSHGATSVAYRDVHGRLMVEGPFAGAMVVPPLPLWPPLDLTSIEGVSHQEVPPPRWRRDRVSTVKLARLGVSRPVRVRDTIVCHDRITTGPRIIRQHRHVFLCVADHP
jgi:hypothetical protein